jgi:hypothetical protein
MLMQHLTQATVAAAPKARLSRRHFITTTVGGATGLALMPALAQSAAAAPGSKPTEHRSPSSPSRPMAPPPSCATAWTWARASRRAWP